jgi:hypothetical protein
VQPIRRRGKTRPRILYWFRTPPGVRVGRAAIDEDAIRQIEASNPDVEFDWPQILKGQTSLPDTAESPRKARDREPGRPGPRTEERAQQIGRPERAAPVGIFESAESAPSEGPDTMGSNDADGANLDVAHPPPDEPASTPAEARLGSAGLARLRARYAELLTRITDRVEPDRQEELKALAERLNPDAWITDADVTAGLDAYEQTYEMVRSSLPPRRKPGEPV